MDGANLFEAMQPLVGEDASRQHKVLTQLCECYGLGLDPAVDAWLKGLRDEAKAAAARGRPRSIVVRPPPAQKPAVPSAAAAPAPSAAPSAAPPAAATPALALAAAAPAAVPASSAGAAAATVQNLLLYHGTTSENVDSILATG